MIEIRKGMRVVFIGDSISDVRFNKKQRRSIGGAHCFPLQVAAEWKRIGMNVKCFFKGIASNRSWHVYDRLTKDVMELKPDLVVLLIGVNDAWEDFVPNQYPVKIRHLEPHFREIIRRLSTELPNAQVLLLTPFITSTIPEKQGFRKILNKYIDIERVIFKEFSYNEIINLQEVFDNAEKETQPQLLATDSVHPTDLGHSLIKNEIIKKCEFIKN